MRSACLILAFGFAVSGSAAGDKGMPRIRIAAQPGCPIEIIPAKSSVSDRRTASAAQRAILGSDAAIQEATGAGAGDVIYTVAARNTGPKTIAAREYLWEAFNAFDEKLGERTYSYAKAIEPGKNRTDYDAGAPLSDDVAYYRISVVRVKFDDGSSWPAP